jgi:molecular chaperone GrpE
MNKEDNKKSEVKTAQKQEQKPLNTDQNQISTETKMKEYLDLLQRMQAEFENYKKRVEKENRQLISCASKNIIQQVIPVLDSFQLALKNTSNQTEFVKGVEMIYSQLYSMLQANGLKKIEAVNQKFDPYMHEALMAVQCDAKPDTVVEELLPGYMLNDVIIRHSKVKVSKGK